MNLFVSKKNRILNLCIAKIAFWMHLESRNFMQRQISFCQEKGKKACRSIIYFLYKNLENLYKKFRNVLTFLGKARQLYCRMY